MLLGEMAVRVSGQIDQYMSSMSQVEQKAQSVGGSVQNHIEQKGGGGLMSFGKKALDMGMKVGMTVIGIKGLGDAFAGMARGLFGANASLEQTKIGFEKLLGSGEKAQAFINELWDFAKRTPFEFGQLTGASHMLMGVGVAAKDVIPWLTGIGDAVSGVGGGAPEIQRATLALVQMAAKGKITGEEMLQLTENRLPAWNLLSQAMGKPTQELMKMSQQGKLMSKDVLPLLIAQMEKTYGGQMQAQAGTFNGIMSTLLDTWRDLVQVAMAPTFVIAKDLVKKLGEEMAKPQFREFAVTLGKLIAEALKLVLKLFMAVVPVITAIIKPFLDAGAAGNILRGVLITIGVAFAGVKIGMFVAHLVSMAPALAGVVVHAAQFALGLVHMVPSVIAMIAHTIAWAVANAGLAISMIAAYWPILLIIAGVAALIAIIVLLVKNWDAVCKWISGIWKAFTSWLTGTLKSIGGWFVNTWNGIKNAAVAVWNWIKGAAIAIWNGIFGAIMNPINTVVGALSRAWSIISGGIRSAWSGMVRIVSGIWSGIVAAVKWPINRAIDIINGFIRAANAVTGLFGLHIGYIGYVAKGGKNLPAGMYVAGEEGPELVDLPGGSDVYTAAQTAALMGRGFRGIGRGASYAYPSAMGGGGPRSITVVIELDSREIGRKTAPVIVEELHVRGIGKR